VTFHASADFFQANFGSFASFHSSSFDGRANFTAIVAEKAFTIEKSKFKVLPDFIQAHFQEAPRLDNVEVPTHGFWRSLGGRGDPDLAARYRALKRLAIQGHDHDREYQFFADELRSLRGNPDRPWHTRYWIGFLYEVISNFGRSISRPVVCWIVLTIFFAEMYLCMHLRVTQAGSCVDGHGNPASQAIYLSVKKGLVFPGLGGDQRVDEALKCLYGGAVLDSVSYAGIIQSLVSAVLIFLFLLAVRNRFRIK
jgi:hypothetical protein